MKKIISYLAVAFVAINITSCDKKDNGSEIKDLALSVTSPLQILAGASTEVTVSGGDEKTYTVESADANVATVAVSANKITVTAVAQGETTVTVKSADKSIQLTVKVLPVLTELGLYNLDGTVAFQVKSTAEKVGISYGFFSELNPTAGKMLVVDLIDTPSQGATQTITVKVRDIEGLQTGNITTTVENVSDKTIQLSTDKYRLVIPQK